jgi:hypothetical protein
MNSAKGSLCYNDSEEFQTMDHSDEYDTGLITLSPEHSLFDYACCDV